MSLVFSLGFNKSTGRHNSISRAIHTNHPILICRARKNCLEKPFSSPFKRELRVEKPSNFHIFLAACGLFLLSGVISISRLRPSLPVPPTRRLLPLSTSRFRRNRVYHDMSGNLAVLLNKKFRRRPERDAALKAFWRLSDSQSTSSQKSKFTTLGIYFY